MSSEDELSDALSSLPVADVDPRLAASIRGRARVVLAHEQRFIGRPGLRRASRAYSRVLEPTVVAALCIGYVYWGLNATLALFH
jgi:hypothetical protein